MGRPSNAERLARDPQGTVLAVEVARELLAHLRKQMNTEGRGGAVAPATTEAITAVTEQLIQLEKQRNDVLIGILVGKNKLHEIMTPERFDEVVAQLMKSPKPYQKPTKATPKTK